MAVYPERRNGKLTGKWIAEVTTQGDRRRKRFATQKEGERWADIIKVTGLEPLETLAVPSSPTFGAVAQEAREHHPGWQADRDPSREQRLCYVIDAIGATTPVSDVRAGHIDRLVASLKNRPGKAGKLSAGTINRYLSCASAVLSYAKSRDYIVGVPTIRWQLEAGRRVHWLTAEAEADVVNAMLAAGEVTCALTVRVLTATGLRWSEFEGLEATQVDGEWIKLDQTKTNTPRDVPIDPLLGAELKALIERKAVPPYHTFRKCLKATLKTAGQSAALSVHGLRHTTATRLVHSDVNLSVVKDFMGHSSINTTLKYTHVSKELLQSASKKLSPRTGQCVQNSPQGVQEVPGREATAGIEPACTDLQSDKK